MSYNHGLHIFFEMWIGEAYPKGGNLHMDSNWYVIQVRSRKEEYIASKCKSLISKDVLTDCFIPKYKKMKKYRGKWHNVEEVLFSGYVFLVSNNVEHLFQELKKIPDLTKLLGNDGTDIYSIQKGEVAFLNKFIKADHILDMSIGYIEGDRVIVNSGPLIGYEGLIRKIDRHKRIAYLDIQLFDQTTTVKVGLEIVSKK